MSAPKIAEHDVTVHQGHVLDVLPLLPAGSVQCVVTSPPYYGLRDYGHEGQIGLEPSPAEYVARMVAVFAQVRRVLAADGVVWLNLGDSYAPSKNLLGIPWRVAFALQDDGWTLRNAVIWHKPNAMPESVTDRLSCRYEHVFLFSKSRRYTFDLDAVREPHSAVTIARSGRARITAYAPPGQTPGRKGETTPNELGGNPGDVWSIPTSPFPGAHFATMPPELARRCILAGCPTDGTVLDPFAGSGTTLKVARSLGRKSVGIELNPAYIDIIRDRIGQTPLDFGEASA
jgi:DNA modification methylase